MKLAESSTADIIRLVRSTGDEKGARTNSDLNSDLTGRQGLDNLSADSCHTDLTFDNFAFISPYIRIFLTLAHVRTRFDTGMRMVKMAMALKVILEKIRNSGLAASPPSFV